MEEHFRHRCFLFITLLGVTLLQSNGRDSEREITSDMEAVVNPAVEWAVCTWKLLELFTFSGPAEPKDGHVAQTDFNKSIHLCLAQEMRGVPTVQ